MSTLPRRSICSALALLAAIGLAACATPEDDASPPSDDAVGAAGQVANTAGAPPAGSAAANTNASLTTGGAASGAANPGSGGAAGTSSMLSSNVGGGSAGGGSAGGATPSAPPSSGSIAFHLLLGVPGYDSPQDSIVLDGDRYTDLIVSNFVAGALYGHLIVSHSPGIRFQKDYLYGSIFGQLLQENLATNLYDPSSPLIDSAADQQAVMGMGQGGPYQINNYAADMVYGGYAPDGYSLINYVALQKNIGYSFESAATQHERATPPAFNDKYLGPIMTAYFHFNDYVALQQIGAVGGYVPAWEPAYDQALSTFKSLDGNFLDVMLNVAYNQGFYGPLLSRYSTSGAKGTSATVAQIDDYASVWGKSDTYEQYPYQVRYYLDQLYNRPIPTTSPTTLSTPQNHVHVELTQLGDIFASCFEQLAYVDPSGHYTTISRSLPTSAFAAALSGAGLSSAASLDLSSGSDRAKLFDLLEHAIAGLEQTTGKPFSARTTQAL
jgi:hypothetical protein